MTDFNIATGEEQPLNRVGVDNVQLTGENQAVPVGIDTTDAEDKLVAADAAADASSDGSSPVTAVGVMFNREVLPAGKYGGVNDHPWDDVEAQIYEENRTKEGDRAVVVVDGVELVNDDSDSSLTPGEPVFLDVGGGFTQTEPSGAGEAVQRLGVALTPVKNKLDPNNAGKDRILLDTEFDYEVA